MVYRYKNISVLTLTIALMLGVVLSALVLRVNSPVKASTYPGLNGNLLYSKQGGDIANYTIYSKLGSNPAVPLTDGSQSDTNASWSADGRKIAFERTETGGGAQDIWYMDADGSNQIAIDQDNGDDDEFPDWAPDGNSLVYQSVADGDWDIYIHNISGGITTNLTDSEDNDTAPRISPDGTKIVYRNDSDGDNEIYVMDIDGQNPTKLTDDSSHDYHPSWTPDGERIVYTKRTGSNHAIYVIDADGDNETSLTSDSENTFIMPSVTPDGQKIIYSSNIGGDFDIYIMDIDGSSPSLLIEDENTVDYWGVYRPLTIAPTSTQPNPEISVNSDGSASIDIPALYIDSYDGVDSSSVSVTTNPSQGTVSVDDNGIVSYQQSSESSASLLSRLSRVFFPVVHADNNQDSFNYQVCSLSSSQLCSSGTVNVNLVQGASAELADTGSNEQYLFFWVLLTSLTIIAVLRRKANNTKQQF